MKRVLVVLVAVASLLVAGAHAQTSMPLGGTWQFAIDPLDRGEADHWYARGFADSVRLPGSMTENGKGDAVTAATRWTGDILDSSYFTSPAYARYRQPGFIKVPFWLQPEVYYCGVAWYRRTIDLSKEWDGASIELFFERCHWQSTVWIDTVLIGSHNALSAPHRFDLTGKISSGTHTITVRVDNRIRDIDPGVNSSSLTDNTQTNWNGIVGRMTLTRAARVHISSLHVYPDVRRRVALCSVELENLTPVAERVSVTLAAGIESPARPSGTLAPWTSWAAAPPGKTRLTLEYPMGKHMRLWDEFSPTVYTMRCAVSTRRWSDTRSTRFGMRTLGTEKTQLTINGMPIFLRGTLECAIFPRTGYPAVGLAEWKRIFTVCKQYGLNHMRFHSWCPPEAAFTAADDLGMYLYVECSSWANPGTSIGDGKPIDRYIVEESEQIVDAFGDHPSFCFLSYGNEPAGAHLRTYLTDFIHVWKQKDNRRLYTGASGWPVSDSSDFHVSYKPRIQHWAEGLKSIINRQAPSTTYDWSDYIHSFTVPVVSHEIGEWCAYPDFRTIRKYDGILKAKSLEIFQQSLVDSGMGELAQRFLDASGRLQVLCYKADIEAALRTRGMAGFELLDLHDFPGQGTAPDGVLDPFWESKGYVTPAEYTQFCNATVPLVRLPKLVYRSDEGLSAEAEVAHFGQHALTQVVPAWRIVDTGGMVVARGVFPRTTIERGGSTHLGRISTPLHALPCPAMYTVEVSVGTFTNRWDFWVYPSYLTDPAAGTNIRIVQRMDDATITFLTKGGVVLYTPVKDSGATAFGSTCAVGFSSIFWNTSWTSKQPPHTLGILCDQSHPLLKEFPTQAHSNYQWWDAMSHASAIQLTALGAGIRPIVRIIDDWFTNRPLGLIVEARVGKGKLILCGVDLLTDAGTRLEARQLAFSILTYMRSAAFAPAQTIDPHVLLIR